MNLAKYLAQKLSDDGYDGLMNKDLECGCFLDDLYPCDEINKWCVPAYNQKCQETCNKKDWCEYPDECLTPDKPAPENHVPLERIKEEA